MRAEVHHAAISTRTVFLLTIGACTLALVPSILWDFAYDQGTFAYGGAAILRGAKPYIDFWDIKPPNIFYTYAAAFAFLGNTIQAIRILDWANAILTIVLLFEFTLRLWTGTAWGRLAAVMASAVFVLQYYIMGPWNTAQVESYSLPWLLLSALLLLPERDTSQRSEYSKLLLSGFALAIAFFFKYSNLVFLPLAVAMLWLHHPAKEPHIKKLALLATGLIVGLGLQTLLLYLQGALGLLIHITFGSTIRYSSNNYSGSFSIISNLREGLLMMEPMWVVAAIIGWSLWEMDRHKHAKQTKVVIQSVMLLALASLLAFIAIKVQNKGYAYHYLILLPWADVLIGAGVAHLATSMHRVDALPRGSNAFFVLVLLVAGSYIWTSSKTLQPDAQAFSEVISGARASNGYIASDTLVHYVTAHTNPSDSIFIFGFHPYVYWRSGRMPANKFLNTIHFKPTYVPLEEREELVTSLQSHPPKLIFVETGDTYTSQGDTPDASNVVIAKRYPEITALLNSRYSVKDTIEGVIAYIRNDSH